MREIELQDLYRSLSTGGFRVTITNVDSGYRVQAKGYNSTVFEITASDLLEAIRLLCIEVGVIPAVPAGFKTA